MTETQDEKQDLAEIRDGQRLLFDPIARNLSLMAAGLIGAAPTGSNPAAS
jgi:hypothetical protein